MQYNAQRLVPFGCSALCFYRGHRTYSLSENEYLPPSHLYSIVTAYTDITMSGGVDFVSIVFQPAGASVFFEPPLDELNNSYVSTDSLNDKQLYDLDQRLNETSDVHQCVALIEKFLTHRIHHLQKYEDQRMDAVIHSICRGETDINRLAENACLGYKQFKRVFTENMGINPKKYLQIRRFQKLHHSFQQHTEASLSQLAEECGYYDKSHLIKELKEFSGLPQQNCKEPAIRYIPIIMPCFVLLLWIYV